MSELKYVGDIKNVKEKFRSLFENYSSLNGEQQDAIKEYAKDCFLGSGEYKFLKAQYISKQALDRLKKCFDSGKKNPAYTFYMDHVVPKTKYIIKPIAELAKESDSKNEKNIQNILENLHYICFITKEQNDALREVHLKSTMPDTFDEKFPIEKIKRGNLKLTEKEKFARYYEAAKKSKAFNDETIFKIKDITKDSSGKLRLIDDGKFKIKRVKK